MHIKYVELPTIYKKFDLDPFAVATYYRDFYSCSFPCCKSKNFVLRSGIKKGGLQGRNDSSSYITEYLEKVKNNVQEFNYTSLKQFISDYWVIEKEIDEDQPKGNTLSIKDQSAVKILKDPTRFFNKKLLIVLDSDSNIKEIHLPNARKNTIIVNCDSAIPDKNIVPLIDVGKDNILRLSLSVDARFAYLPKIICSKFEEFETDMVYYWDYPANINAEKIKISNVWKSVGVHLKADTLLRFHNILLNNAGNSLTAEGQFVYMNSFLGYKGTNITTRRLHITPNKNARDKKDINFIDKLYTNQIQCDANFELAFNTVLFVEELHLTKNKLILANTKPNRGKFYLIANKVILPGGVNEFSITKSYSTRFFIGNQKITKSIINPLLYTNCFPIFDEPPVPMIDRIGDMCYEK